MKALDKAIKACDNMSVNDYQYEIMKNKGNAKKIIDSSIEESIRSQLLTLSGMPKGSKVSISRESDKKLIVKVSNASWGENEFYVYNTKTGKLTADK